MITSLSNVESEFRLEFDVYKFLYKRIFTPDNNPSIYFNIFYKDVPSPSNWKTIRGTLSNEYSVLDIDSVIEKYFNKFKLSNPIKRFRNYKALVKIDVLFRELAFDGTESFEEDKALVTPEMNLLARYSSLSSCFMSSFSGGMSPTLTFNYFSAVEHQNSKTGLLGNCPINNMFIFGNSVNLIVDTTINLDVDIFKIYRSVNDRVELFRSIDIDMEFLGNLRKTLPRKMFKTMVKLLDRIDNKFHNLYSVTNILSYLLVIKNDIYLEINIKNFIYTYFGKQL